MYVVVLSHGYGHGNGAGDDMLFPLHRPLRIVLNSAVTAESLIYFSQYVLYGVFLAFANRCRLFRPATIALVGFHGVCFFARDLIADLLIRVGF